MKKIKQFCKDCVDKFIILPCEENEDKLQDVNNKPELEELELVDVSPNCKNIGEA